MLIKALFIDALEQAVNRYIALDPDAGTWLRPLCGKVIAVKPTMLPFDLYLSPCEDGIQLLRDYAGKPDTTLTGSLLAFCSLGLGASPRRALFSGDVTMEGDVETGRRLQAFFQRVDVDPEEQLSRITGDVIAHQVGNLVRAGHAWGQTTLATFRMNLSEYLQEESRELPTRPEAEMFYADVDALRAAGDRLEARVARLEKALAAAAGSS